MEKFGIKSTFPSRHMIIRLCERFPVLGQWHNNKQTKLAKLPQTISGGRLAHLNKQKQTTAHEILDNRNEGKCA